LTWPRDGRAVLGVLRLLTTAESPSFTPVPSFPLPSPIILHSLPSPVFRFVREFPGSCAPFPIRARFSRFVRAVPISCAAFPRDVVNWPLTGAIRSTPRPQLERIAPPPRPQLERIAPPPGRFFPIRARHSRLVLFGAMARHLHMSRGMSRAARSVATGARRATGATVRGPLLHPRLHGFSFPSNSLSIPPKEILS
jgi:hypothetical protein